MIENKTKLRDDGRIICGSVDRNTEYGYDSIKNIVKYNEILISIEILGYKITITKTKVMDMKGIAPRIAFDSGEPGMIRAEDKEVNNGKVEKSAEKG